MNKKTKKRYTELPTASQLEAELKRVRRKGSPSMRNIVFTLLISVCAIAALLTLVMPVLQIYGSSMAPTLNNGDVCISFKGGNCNRGDIIAFYFNNKILVKRVIALPGDVVDMDSDGNVYINYNLFDEPYLTQKAYGECDAVLPYTVPESRYFVMGDNRAASVDSRSIAVGCVAEEQIVGRLACRIWPPSGFGTLTADSN